MFRFGRLPLLFKVFLGFASVFALAGCAEKPAPPVFSLYGYQRLAVIPFDNQTRDPDLPGAVAEEMTNEIAQVNAVPIIQASQVAAFLSTQGATGADLLNNEGLRQKLAKKFQCDLLLMGSADGYVEDLKDQAPERVVESSGEAKWGFYTNRKVTVSASAKLIDPSTGSLVWSQKNKGWSWHNTWNELPMIPAEIQIPDQINRFLELASLARHRVLHEKDEEPNVIDQNDPNVLLYPQNQYFSQLRQNAVGQTVGGIVADFRPRGGWTPQLKGNAQ